MKRKITAAALVLLLVLSAVTAFAESLPLFVDGENLISDSQGAKLSQRLEEVSRDYECDVVIVTVYSLQGKTVTEYADDYFDYQGYGQGASGDGILLLICMQQREYAISTKGKCIDVFTDANLRYMEDRFVGYLSDGEYNDAFNEFVTLCEGFLEQAASGRPYGSDDADRQPLSLIWIPISLVIGFVLALIITGAMKGRLKTVHMQSAADNYVRADSMQITRSSDVFLYANVSKHKRPENNSSSGGSSTHISSSGSTHGGSHGRF